METEQQTKNKSKIGILSFTDNVQNLGQTYGFSEWIIHMDTCSYFARQCCAYLLLVLNFLL